MHILSVSLLHLELCKQVWKRRASRWLSFDFWLRRAAACSISSTCKLLFFPDNKGCVLYITKCNHPPHHPVLRTGCPNKFGLGSWLMANEVSIVYKKKLYFAPENCFFSLFLSTANWKLLLKATLFQFTK